MRKEINNNQKAKAGDLCFHLINGRTLIPKTCIHNYECWKCAFDQWLEEIEAEIFIPANAVYFDGYYESTTLT